jgi:hypothetical protein
MTLYRLGVICADGRTLNIVQHRGISPTAWLLPRTRGPGSNRRIKVLQTVLSSD